MLKGSKINLIPFTNDHIKATFDWVVAPDFQHWFLLRGKVTWEGHQQYFAQVLTDPTQRVFAIIGKDTHVGNCGFKNLTQKEGELWIYIGDSSWRGQGIGGKATQLLLDKGFVEMGLEIIYLHFRDSNIAAHKLYEKVGFVEAPLESYNDEWSNRDFKIVRMELKRQKWM